MGAVEEYKARNAEREARRAEKQKPPKKEPWFFNQPQAIGRFTAWLVIATVVLAFIAGMQLNQMRSAFDEQKLADLLLTRGILTFNPNSWEMNGAREGNVDNTISTTGTQTISFILKNTGKNPAYIMQSSYEYIPYHELPPVKVDQKTGDLRLIGTSAVRMSDIPSLFGQEESIRLVIPNLPAIDEDGKQAITDGKKYAYLRIVIFYLDQFNWAYEFRITAQYGRKVNKNGATVYGFVFPERNVTDGIKLNAKAVNDAWLDANTHLCLKWRAYNYIVATSKGPLVGRRSADCPMRFGITHSTIP
jgi:hypothetical protein